MIPIILAGGIGKRLWPISRKDYPKQFLSLDKSHQTLLQKTASRLLSSAKCWQNIWVFTIEPLKEIVQSQLPNLPQSNILVQPDNRDTAPAIAWATLEITQLYGRECIIGSFPADHWIPDDLEFTATLHSAELVASRNSIVTLGILPDYPSTHYGYIKKGTELDTDAETPAYKVHKFIEKPNVKIASSLIEEGSYLWDSGILIFKGSTMISELYKHLPEVIAPLDAMPSTSYLNLPERSIYFDLMEKTQNACVLQSSFEWDDLGNWNTIERLNKSRNSNTELAQHFGIGTQNSLIYSSDPGELVVTLGLDDIVIVRDKNVTLVMKKDKTQDIKKILKRLDTSDDLRDFL